MHGVTMKIVHIRVHNSPTFVPILTQINIRLLPATLIKFHFNIIFISVRMYP